MNKDIQTIYSDSKKQRVTVFQRDDETFGFLQEYFSEDEFEMCWVPIFTNWSYFDTEETALREVYGRVDWLIGKETS